MESSVSFGKGFNNIVLCDNQIFRGGQYTSNHDEVTKNLSNAIEYSMRMGLKNVTASCLIGKNNGISFNVVVTAIRDDSYNNNDNYYYKVSISIDNPDKRDEIACKIKELFNHKKLPIPTIDDKFVNLVLDFVVENNFGNIYGCFDTLIDAFVDVLFIVPIVAPVTVHDDLNLVM